jgi:membrane protein implicated in regulation of membrane protease activity
MAMLLLMYLLIDVTAAIVKGKKPAQELLRSLTQIKALLQLMLAPLSMMLVGLLLAVFQFRNPDPEDGQQQGGARALGSTAAAASSKEGIESRVDGESAACPC